MASYQAIDTGLLSTARLPRKQVDSSFLHRQDALTCALFSVVYLSAVGPLLQIRSLLWFNCGRLKNDLPEATEDRG